MKNVGNALTLALVIFGVLMIPGNLLADSTAELFELRREIEAQRKELDQKQLELDQQRQKLDSSLRKLEAIANSSGVQMEPVKIERPKAPYHSVESFDEEPAPIAIDPADTTTVNLYGFAQMDSIYDFNSVDPNWTSTLRPSRIPVNCPGDPGCGKDGETIFSTRQSRFGIDGQTPSSLGPVKARLEFDLFATGSDAGETNFRIRHAYGEVGQVGAGQTDSLFTDPTVFPNTIDYWGPAGMLFLRNPQLRWTPYKEDGTTFATALEAPNAAIDAGTVTEIDPTLEFEGRTQLPDLTLQARHADDDWGWIQLASVFREVAYESPENPGGNPSGEEFAFGVNLTGGIDLFQKDRIVYQFAYGEGISSYFNDGGNDISSNGRGGTEALPIVGWLAYYNRTWNENWTSSIGFSETRQDNSAGQTDDAFKTGQYFSANVLYRPDENLLFGPEVLWGRRENNDGADGEDTRIQFSAKYSFGGSIYNSTP